MSAYQIAFIFLIILITVKSAIGNSLDSDKEVLLSLRSFLEQKNKINQGNYNKWDPRDPTPCTWPGISCSDNRVTGISLPDNHIAGNLFGNFSALTELTHLDLSTNTIDGTIPADLDQCQKLKVLNLSHNIMEGELNFTNLSSLEILDLSVNRFYGEIKTIFPEICDSFLVANLSSNRFTGDITSSMNGCLKLEYVDLSSNFLTGNLWFGFHRFKEFSVSENRLNNTLPGILFRENCSLEVLDLSGNEFSGGIPKEVSNCENLTVLNLSGNFFSEKIPTEIGSIAKLDQLLLGNNSFSREIPESLLGLNRLNYLDLSRNRFGGDIQAIFGQFRVKNLLLHANGYTGGLNSSGILRLQNISRLDLSFNEFSGPLPSQISQMGSLRYLILAGNQFSGRIPSEFGNLHRLQALDLSMNDLNGSIPSSFGRLKSLLWLMLANNSLTGQIPPELGNCSSLLWLNLANNQLSGPIPRELANIGKNATPTFVFNRENNPMAGSGECSAMRRWIPADYPPFSFVYTLLNRKSCRSLWDTILKGNGVFPVCFRGSNIRTLQMSGYCQLSGNRLSGQIPSEIGKMENFSMLHLGNNEFSGNLPAEIGELPLVVLNITRNKFSGQIPMQLGYLKCLRNLDLSYNNFSGTFPASFINLNDLSKFNVSYNRYISGMIPATGQLATFDKSSFLGDPLLILPSFIDNSTNGSFPDSIERSKQKKWGAVLVFMFLLLASMVCGGMTILVCLVTKSPVKKPEKPEKVQDFTSNSSGLSPWLSDTVKVIRLDKTAFTHTDILKATGNFANERIIGRGGFGTVYRGILPDGREVAIKKKLRDGIEGEREFRAEMEVLSRNGFGWPNPNLVTLYGWCLYGSEKLLVYEYMDGGNLDDLIPDRTTFKWKQRIDVAIDVARALVFLHHECYPSIVHRDVKASNVLLDKHGKARVTDFGLARVVDIGDSHVSTMVAGTVGYVAPEYGQTWQATTKGDVYSYGVLVMELAAGRRAVDGGEECLLEWARRVMGDGPVVPASVLVSGDLDGSVEMCELLRIGIRCTAEAPRLRPNMKEVLDMLVRILANRTDFSYGSFLQS